MKAKTALTAEAVRKAIEEKKPASMTQLAHGLGYKGSVGGSLAKKFRQLIPDIDVLLKGTTGSAKAGDYGKAVASKPKAKAKPAAKAKGKWPRESEERFSSWILRDVLRHTGGPQGRVAQGQVGGTSGEGDGQGLGPRGLRRPSRAFRPPQ